MKKHEMPRRPWGTWAAYAVAGCLFAAGQLLLIGGRLQAGGVLAAAGVIVALAVYLLPDLALRRFLQAALQAARRPPRLALRERVAGLRAAVRPDPRARLASLGNWFGARLLAWFPDDCVRLNRYWLLAPTAGLLLLSQIAMRGGGTTRAVIFLALAVLLACVYLQDRERPLRLPNLRRNLLALAAFLAPLPLQAWGVYLLHARFSQGRLVWWGSFLCAFASALMIYSLRRWPFDLEDAEEAESDSQEDSDAEPFFSSIRLAWGSSLLTGAAVSAYLAKVVFPAEHAGWSVAMGFLAMALLIGSFPWIPRGLAWWRRLPPAAAAAAALAAALTAFSLGRQGQVLIERGNVNSGLWWFLAGGVVLVLGLSRRNALEPDATAAPAPAWPRLEVSAVLLLTAAAFAFRIWNIGQFPYGSEGDEAGGGVWAMDVLKGSVEHPLIHQNYPLAFFSITAFFFKFMGVNMETLRIHSVIFGTLSVVTTYLFLRLLFGRWSAFLTTLLMTFSYWHIHYSRFGHYNIEQVALQMTAFYFVFKAMRTGLLWQWVTGGAAFGLAMFPHMAGRLLPFQGIALLLYFFAGRRDLLRRYLPGFMAFVMGAWMLAAPAVVYWERARGISMGRIQSVSIFDKNNSNAPVDTLAGFVRNCKVSMMMFNAHGDTRHRNNPLAPEKILEHWTAILFGLAFLYSLWHWRDPAVFFLLAAFFINLAASIFSVEAPQTLRTAGNIPLIFAMIALPLAHLRRALLRAGRWPAGLVFALLLLPAAAFFSWRSGQKYFVQARNLSFDVQPTYIAALAGTEGKPEDQAAFWATGFASSHPPVLLFALGTPIRNFYSFGEYLPITQGSGKDHLLFLNDDFQQALPYLKWLYPEAPVRPMPNLLGGADLAAYIKVSREHAKALQGLKAVLDENGAKVQVERVAPRWPVAGHEQAAGGTFQGSLYLETYGRHQFEASGKGDVSIWVNDRLAYERRNGAGRSVETLWGRGLQRFKMSVRPASRGEAIEVLHTAIQAPGPNAFFVQRGMSKQALNQETTFSLEPFGFYAEYFSNRLPEGSPTVEVVEPVVMNHFLDSPLPGNYSVRWRAKVKAETAGDHRFSFRGGAVMSRIKVNGRLVWSQGMLLGASEAPQVPTHSISLEPGWHDYEAVASFNGPPFAELRMETPGQGDGLIMPPRVKPVLPR